MNSMSKKVEERLAAGVKHFQPILTSAKARDVNESDTVIIVTDMISEVFGYDKYSEVFSEILIRGTYCDLAVGIEKTKIQFLVEVKGIGTELKDHHVVQAVGYAANKGVDWVVLTNGVNWRVYQVSFGKPIGQELVLELDFLKLNFKNEEDLARLHLLCKEGWQKQAMKDFAVQKQALSRFFIAEMVLSEPVLDVIRRELKRTCPDVKIKNEQIQAVLLQEVLKREVVEGEKADEARKKITRASNRQRRVQNTDSDNEPQAAPVALPPLAAPPPVESGPCGK